MTESIDGFSAQAQLCAALSHPVRLQILEILSHQEACVCHLTAALGQRQPYISQQLATLREAGLVTDRREGTLIYYRLSHGVLADLLEQGRGVVRELEGPSLAFPPPPKEVLAECPCPRCRDAACLAYSE